MIKIGNVAKSLDFMKNALGLMFPQAQSKPHARFDVSPRAIEQWLENLPRASVGNCAKELYTVLENTNRQSLSQQDRSRLLEAMREPVDYVSQAMLKHYVGTAFPLPEKSLRIATINHEIYHKMAEGYCIAIEDLLVSKFILLEKKALTLLIHRALSYLGQVLLNSYRIYGTVSAGVWFNLNTLYHYAEQKKLHRTTISDEYHQHVRKTSIADEYIRILLLSLASPYRLYQGEADNVYVNLERWINLVSLHVYDRNVPRQGKFIVVLNRDEPPVHLELYPADDIAREEIENQIRIVDTSALLKAVATELQRDEDSVSNTLVQIRRPEASLSHDLLGRLDIAWGAATRRMFPRKERQSNLELSIGLSATHQAMLTRISANRGNVGTLTNDDSQLLRLIDTRSEYQSKTISSATDQEPDVWEMVYNRGKLQMIQENGMPEDVPLNGNNAQVYSTIDNWMLVNESAGGICIKCNSDCGKNIKVGEIIGLSEENQRNTQSDSKRSDNWSLGIIRWVRMSGEHGVKMGGQFIGKGAIPVAISLAYEDNSKSNLQRALLVPSVRAVGKPSTLITHASLYRIGQIIRLHMLNQVVDIKLVREYRETGLYSEFEYEQVAEKTITSDHQIRAEAVSDDTLFKDLWTGF